MSSTNKLTIYCIPGLGANKYLFKRLKLDGYNVRHVEWIDPNKNETLSNYAMRLAEQIDTSAPFALMGVSFGGMCCIEIAKQLSPLKTFLISSNKTHLEFPFRFRVFAILPIYRLLRGNFQMRIVWLLKIFFRVTPDFESDFVDVIGPLPKNYLPRATDMIIHWKNETIPDNVVHIQGTDDRVLPCKVNVSYQYLIKKGTHVMVLAHAAEISKILNKELEVIKF